MKSRSRRGSALIEFALAMPFAVMLFVGIGDFGVYFWRQTQMEEAARFALTQIQGNPAPYASVDDETLEKLGRHLEAEVRQETRSNEIAVAISRKYACPLPNGAEDALFEKPQLCDGIRVYLQVASERAVSPLLQPLRWMGFPKSALNRHLVRVR